MDEYIEVMRTLWMSDGPASFHGRAISFDNVACEPKPVQKPHPPLWIGGSSEVAPRRTVRLGNARHPSSRSPEEIGKTTVRLWHLANIEGRGPIDTIMRAVLHLLPEGDRKAARRPLIGAPKEIRSAIRDYQVAGVRGFVLDTFYGSSEVEHKTTDEVVSTLEYFAKELMPEFTSR